MRRAAPAAPAVPAVPLPPVVIDETTTVASLAAALDVPTSKIEETLAALGSPPASEVESVGAEDAELVVAELGRESTVCGDALRTAARGDVRPRSPVVGVLGHVDHGKTTLLDALRRSSVAAGEAGGITQRVAAFSVRLPGDGGRALTFLDTPGHAAFSAMRERGAAAADVVVLAVAADDGPRPQTYEALEAARSAGCALVVALTKIDRPGADVERAKRQLASAGVELEEDGGDVPVVEVCAPEGLGLDDLSEAVLLSAELKGLDAAHQGPAEGVVVEARVDRGRGPVATVVVKEGALEVGQAVVVGDQWGRVRALVAPEGMGEPVVGSAKRGAANGGRTGGDDDGSARGSEAGDDAHARALGGAGVADADAQAIEAIDDDLLDALLTGKKKPNAATLQGAKGKKGKKGKKQAAKQAGDGDALEGDAFADDAATATATPAATHGDGSGSDAHGGQSVQIALPGQAVEVVGLRGVPNAGDRLQTVRDEARAAALAEARHSRAVAERHARAANIKAARDRAEAAVKAQLERQNASAGKAGANRAGAGASTGTGAATATATTAAATGASASPAAADPTLLNVPRSVRLIIKSDSDGAAQAASDAMRALSADDATVEVISCGIGPVTVGDVRAAAAVDARIVAYGVSPGGGEVKALAKQEGVEIFRHAVIYRLLEEAEEWVSGAAPRVAYESLVGEARVLKPFKIRTDDGVAVVAGCAVSKGSIRVEDRTWKLVRNREEIWRGHCKELRRGKLVVDAVGEGAECGVLLENGPEVQEGDVLRCFEIEMLRAADAASKIKADAKKNG